MSSRNAIRSSIAAFTRSLEGDRGWFAKAKVQFQPRSYPKSAERLVRLQPTESVAQAAQLKMNLPSF